MSDAGTPLDPDCARPLNLIAELTYRCPLRCPYCSNPVDHATIRDQLGTEDWTRVFQEAADLGVLHVGLTGGEPTTRKDLAAIVQGADQSGLYTLLVTAGMPVDRQALERLVDAGLRSVQLSIQDAQAEQSNAIAGTESFSQKLRFAKAVRELGLPLTLNVVLHRRNLDRVEELIVLARDLDAERLELANVQFHGWARLNRAALMPTATQLKAASETVRRARKAQRTPEIVLVLPDHFSGRPKPCMGGWGRKNIVVTPTGAVQPCQEAGTIPGLEFWSVQNHSLADCWSQAPGMNAFRGEEWMREPCKTCPERSRDFGGCRCQSFHFTADAANTDPACRLSPLHHTLEETQAERSESWTLRGSKTRPDPSQS